MIKKFFYYLNLLLKCRYKFKKPAKKQILLYDQGFLFNKQFKQNFKEFNIDILYTRLEEINLYVLIKSLLKLKSLSKDFIFLNYLKTYCVLCRPDWIITSNHNDLKFYKLKKMINLNTKFAIIQRNPIFEFHIKNFFKKVLNNEKKLIVDYFFCFDDFSKKILRNFLNTKFVTIGSFKNNCSPLQKLEKNMDILLISGFRTKFINMTNKQSHIIDIEQEKKLVKLLILISQKENLNFKILLKPLTKVNEYIKFNQIKEDYCIFNNGLNNYSIIDKFRLLLFSNDSTLIFEGVARRKKFCLVQPNYQLDNEKMKWSCVLKTDLNYDTLNDLINSTIDQDFKTFTSNNIKLDKQIPFDENNNILKSYINSEKKELVRAN